MAIGSLHLPAFWTETDHTINQRPRSNVLSMYDLGKDLFRVCVHHRYYYFCPAGSGRNSGHDAMRALTFILSVRVLCCAVLLVPPDRDSLTCVWWLPTRAGAHGGVHVSATRAAHSHTPARLYKPRLGAARLSSSSPLLKTLLQNRLTECPCRGSFLLHNTKASHMSASLPSKESGHPVRCLDLCSFARE